MKQPNNELHPNAEAAEKLLDQMATPDTRGTALLTKAVDKMKLSACGYHLVMCVARTLADLECADSSDASICRDTELSAH